ncbi:hypothetical protein OLK001_07200 [Synechocystis sp. LKSZ1]
MSGTSVDGIDAALVEISGSRLDLRVELLQGATYPYSPALRRQILAVCAGQTLTMAEWADLDEAIAIAFAQAAQNIQTGYPHADLIGSHGQTVFHRPPQGQRLGYSCQLGRGEVIAQLTAIPTVSHFRQADLAAGGQGAPLVSKIDACLLGHDTEHRCIQNIGGIGNVTYLPPRQTPDWEDKIRGWDTGPGNVLIDLAVQRFSQGQQTYDHQGQWAAQGQPYQPLVDQWLRQDFFQQPPPKSTGRELFGPDYLQQCWQDAQAYTLGEADFLATLTELTARSIVENYRAFLPCLPDTLLLCGGGSHNLYLQQRLAQHLGPQTRLATTTENGLASDYKEAIAFAILAYWRFYNSFPGNLPQVTGAQQPCLLGEIHPKIG